MIIRGIDGIPTNSNEALMEADNIKWCYEQRMRFERLKFNIQHNKEQANEDG